MVDYGMDDDEWNARKGEIEEWYETNPDHIGIKVTTDGIFAIGDGQPQLRRRHWRAIGSMFAHLGEDSPVDPESVILCDDDQSDEDNRYCEICGDEGPDDASYEECPICRVNVFDCCLVRCNTPLPVTGYCDSLMCCEDCWNVPPEDVFPPDRYIPPETPECEGCYGQRTADFGM